MSIFDGSITLTQASEDMAKLIKHVKMPFYAPYNVKYRNVAKDIIAKVAADIKDEPFDSLIRQVIFNPPYTTVVWTDGTSTVVKAADGEPFSPYYGICVAICKDVFGSSNALNKFVDKQIKINDARLHRKNKKADKKKEKIKARKDAELMKAEKKE